MRQVTGESLVQGLLGGVVGAVIGVGARGADRRASASTSRPRSAPPRAPRGGPGGGPFGQGAVEAGTSTVSLEAPVDAGMLLLAIGLAVLGGLIAGAVGGLRAARLRPAEALRSVD